MNADETINKVVFHIAIFASGTGTNTQNIIDHFRNSPKAKIVLIVSNNPSSGVLQIAKKENISYLVTERKKFYEDGYLAELKEFKIDLIVLAGFLWKIPSILTKNYSNKIINIHPALLPKFGGKGMYGNFVHEAVITNKETENGITIHYIDEIYDHGKIIFQIKCKVDESDTAETLSKKIHALEHEHYPIIIETLIKS